MITLANFSAKANERTRVRMMRNHTGIQPITMQAPEMKKHMNNSAIHVFFAFPASIPRTRAGTKIRTEEMIKPHAKTGNPVLVASI
jgi:hypothetical protein